MPNLQRKDIQKNTTGLEEKCGIVTLFLPNESFSKQLIIGRSAAGAVQHRGQLGVGIAYLFQEKIKRYVNNGLVLDVLTNSFLEKLPVPKNNSWIQIHCRYGTAGGYDKRNLQPSIAKSPNGDEVSVIHNGQFTAINDLKKRVGKLTNESYPSDISDTYLFTKLLAYSEGKNWGEKLINALSIVNGAYSLIIGTKKSVLIARDRYGLKPLVLGKLKGGYIIASETFALDKLGIPVEREVLRGEVIEINKNGLFVIQKGLSGKGNYCDFEWQYFSRPNSMSPNHVHDNDSTHPEKWLSNLLVRERSGMILAREYPIKNVDFVVGIPDSGVAVATGFAQEANLPYRQLILRDHYDENGNIRLFLTDNKMDEIGKKVLGKLSLATGRGLWKNAIVVIGDDSIVRGNVSKELTNAIFKAGAKEVHIISSFPEIMFPCHLGVSMRTKKELIAARNNGNRKKITKEIGATSVNFISHKGMIEARLPDGKVRVTKNPKEIFLANGGCGGCITGLYPVDKDGKDYDIKNIRFAT